MKSGELGSLACINELYRTEGEKTIPPQRHRGTAVPERFAIL
jgi:hypothetical protein